MRSSLLFVCVFICTELDEIKHQREKGCDAFGVCVPVWIERLFCVFDTAVQDRTPAGGEDLMCLCVCLTERYVCVFVFNRAGRDQTPGGGEDLTCLSNRAACLVVCLTERHGCVFL